jgi:glycosyltransferase involved in cell wall biosynthesis
VGRRNHIIPDEALERQNERAQQERDNLRQQYQHVRVELARYQNLPYLLKKALAAIRSEVRFWVRYGKRKIHSKLVRPPASSTVGEGFKPYEARILYPTQTTRPRITHFIGNFNTGGSSRLVVDLIEHLGHRYDQEIVTRSLPDPPHYVVPAIRTHSREYSRQPSVWTLLAHLQKLRPELIHVHYWGELDWDWYNVVFEAASSYGCDIIENVNTPTDPFFSDAVSCYVYVSDHVRRHFGFAGTRELTIYPGTDVRLFSRREKASIPDDCVGMVYRLESDKLDETAIDVFIKVTQRRRGTRALVVGGGPLLTAYKDAVRRAGLGDVFTFTGPVSYEQLPSFYEQMSLFVAPVYRESFGQVSVFAMGMGIPVVGYRVGALPEILGDNGLLAPPQEVDELAELVIELLNDRGKRVEIGVRNRNRAEQFFSIESMIDAYSKLYEETLQLPRIERNHLRD